MAHKGTKNLKLKPWKPGQSGNPKGKPKGRQSLSTLVKGFLDIGVDVSMLGPKQAAGLRTLLGEHAAGTLTIRDLLLLRQVTNGLMQGSLASTDYLLKAAGEFKDELAIKLQQDFTDDEAMRVLQRVMATKKAK